MVKRISMLLALLGLVGFFGARILVADEHPKSDKPAWKACDQSKVEKGWKCNKCNKVIQDMSKEVDEKGNCKACGEKPVEIDVCVKTGWWCEKCGAQSLEKSDCAACKCAMSEKTVRSEIIWICPGCKAKMKQGDHCKGCDKDAVKSCNDSGTFPHVTKG